MATGSHRSINVTELAFMLVVLGMVVAIAIALMLSETEQQTTPQRASSHTHLRGIHQALMSYAYETNNGYFVGLDREGEDVGLTVEARFKWLIDGNYLPPKYLLNPVDEAVQQWESGPFTSNHYSYAMLQVPESGGRYEEWGETLNPRAIVLSDRNTGTVTEPRSVVSDPFEPGWQGGVVWNDNHVTFESTHRHRTVYGDVRHRRDHLFHATGYDDAYLIHSGNDVTPGPEPKPAPRPTHRRGRHFERDRFDGEGRGPGRRDAERPDGGWPGR